MCFRRRFINQTAVLGIGFLIVLSTFVAVSPADPPPATAAETLTTLKGSLARLADRDPTVRDTAKEELMGIAPADLPALRAAVEQMRPLPPGVADALHEIVTHVFLAGQNTDGDSDQGFMGIMMVRSDEAVYSDDGEVDSDLPLGVVVKMRLPGFAAYRSLHDGDVILAITAGQMDERRIHSSDEITALISRFAAGTRVRLQILRHGRRSETTITLDARPRELDSGQPAPDVDLYRRMQAQKAQAFWTARFAPVVDDSVS